VPTAAQTRTGRGSPSGVAGGVDGAHAHVEQGAAPASPRSVNHPDGPQRAWPPAAELLLSMIDQNLHREEVSDVVLAPALVVRRSTAPPPPAGSA
jgi:hypothetical protein